MYSYSHLPRTSPSQTGTGKNERKNLSHQTVLLTRHRQIQMPILPTPSPHNSAYVQKATHCIAIPVSSEDNPEPAATTTAADDETPKRTISAFLVCKQREYQCRGRCVTNDYTFSVRASTVTPCQRLMESSVLRANNECHHHASSNR